MKISKNIVGIIGGTGINQDCDIIGDVRTVRLEETPYGWASDKVAIAGEINGVQVFILSRHGDDHDVNPSNVNYRANLWSLVKQLNCTHILVTSACGSLKENIKPGDLGILDQYIDRTCGIRERSFYKVCHVSQRKPIDGLMQKFIFEACEELGFNCHKDLTCVTIEGPRFSTLAESNLHRSWNCDVVNMTSVPEVQLASELGVIYGCILLITDYDCWRSEEESVQADIVVERMKYIGKKVRMVIPKVIDRIAKTDWTKVQDQNEANVKSSIMCL